MTCDHNMLGRGKPVLFETMLFPNPDDYQEGGCWRWHTWDEAEAGHARILAGLEVGREPEDLE